MYHCMFYPNREEIAKRTKSKNRMHITEFLTVRLSQHKCVLREILTVNVGKVFGTPAFAQFVWLSLVWVMTWLARFAIESLPVLGTFKPEQKYNHNMLACAWYNAGKYNNHVLVEIRNESYIQKFFFVF